MMLTLFPVYWNLVAGLDRVACQRRSRPALSADWVEVAAEVARSGPAGAGVVRGAPHVAVGGSAPEHVDGAAGLGRRPWPAAERAHAEVARHRPGPAAHPEDVPQVAVGALEEHVHGARVRRDRCGVGGQGTAEAGRRGPARARRVACPPQLAAGALPEHVDSAAGLPGGGRLAAEPADAQAGRGRPGPGAEPERMPQLAVGALPEHINGA